jgi:replication factor A1
VSLQLTIEKDQMRAEDIVRHILSQCQDVTREAVLMAIEAKKTASGGLLTDEAAARLVAIELGTEVTFKQPVVPRIRIGQLISGLNDVTIFGRVFVTQAPKAFRQSDGGEGQVAKLLIADETGHITVVLWNDKADLANRAGPGQIVKILHGYVRRSRRGEMELHVGDRGDLEIAPSEVEEADFPSVEDRLDEVANIGEGGRKVNVEGTIRSIRRMSSFQRRDGTQGKVMRAALEDDTGRVSVVFWNEKAEEVANVKEGLTVLLVNAKVKRNRKDRRLELHIDASARVEVPRRHARALHVGDLKEGMKLEVLEGTLATKPIEREVVTKRGDKVNLASFELEDDNGRRIWVSVWSGRVEAVRDLDEGSKVRLRDVRVRKGFGNQLEISAGASSRIEVVK